MDKVTGIHDFINKYEILSAIESADINSGNETHAWRTLIDKVIVYPEHVLEFHKNRFSAREEGVPDYEGVPSNLINIFKQK